MSMTLTVVAEILSGETLISPSGPIDTATTTAESDEDLWNSSDLVDLVAGPALAPEPVVLISVQK
jgi:hypothetical protein